MGGVVAAATTIGYDSDETADGFNANGIHKDTGTKFNLDGYDNAGFNSDGYDINGYNNLGYDVDGYNLDGYNLDGFDRDGI